VTSSHEEYVPRTRIIDAARPLHAWQKEWHNLNSPPDGKQSPEMNKKKAKAMKSPAQPPPEIDLPASKVKPNMGITPSVFRFLEVCAHTERHVQTNKILVFRSRWPNVSPLWIFTSESHIDTLCCSRPICCECSRKRGQSCCPRSRPPNTWHGQFPHGHLTCPSSSQPSWWFASYEWQSSTSSRYATAAKPARNKLQWTKCQYKPKCQQQEEEAERCEGRI
jgi:hypothetical protein